MTPQEINALVAEKVMGWCEVDTVTGLNPKLMERAIPNYCQDISAAWEVVEKLREEGIGFEFDNFVSDAPAPSFYKIEEDFMVPLTGNCWKTESTPMAISLAALNSVGIEVKDE